MQRRDHRPDCALTIESQLQQLPDDVQPARHASTPVGVDLGIESLDAAADAVELDVFDHFHLLVPVKT